MLQDLKDIVAHVKPHALIGLSAAGPSWPEPVIRELGASVDCPLIFPLSSEFCWVLLCWSIQVLVKVFGLANLLIVILSVFFLFCRPHRQGRGDGRERIQVSPE